jgi:hypothetical protein
MLVLYLAGLAARPKECRSRVIHWKRQCMQCNAAHGRSMGGSAADCTREGEHGGVVKIVGCTQSATVSFKRVWVVWARLNRGWWHCKWEAAFQSCPKQSLYTRGPRSRRGAARPVALQRPRCRGQRRPAAPCPALACMERSNSCRRGGHGCVPLLQRSSAPLRRRRLQLRTTRAHSLAQLPRWRSPGRYIPRRSLRRERERPQPCSHRLRRGARSHHGCAPGACAARPLLPALRGALLQRGNGGRSGGCTACAEPILGRDATTVAAAVDGLRGAAEAAGWGARQPATTLSATAAAGASGRVRRGARA